MDYRVLRTAKVTLSRTFYLDEEATNATGDVTVTVERLDGTVVQSGTATPGGEGTYTFTFNGSDDLDLLTLTWSATVGGDAIVLDQDAIEIVGGFFVGLSQIRNADPVLRDTTRYPTQDLIEKRMWVEDEFERICGQAFVPRFARDVLSGAGRAPLKLRWPLLRRVRSVSIAGTALAVDAVEAFGADPLGLLRRDTGWPVGQGNVVVEYEHGMDRCPVGISNVAPIRIKSRLLTTKSPLPDRAERIATTEVGLVTLAIAKSDSTGIPEVDAELGRHPNPRPGFG